jgi:hypothetical protein
VKSPVIGRACLWLLSWIFIVASLLLMTEFIMIHDAITSEGEYKEFTQHQSALINFIGTLEAILWLEGFILLLYWQIYELTGAGIPFNAVGTFGVVLKLIASCFFNVQPASGLLYEQPLGVHWSNFVGICLFHTGNLVNTYESRTLFNSSRPFCHDNLPVIAMWVYTTATTLLVTADGLDYYGVTAPTYIPFGQITGAALLTVGSIIYAYYSRPTWIFSSGGAFTALYETVPPKAVSGSA